MRVTNHIAVLIVSQILGMSALCQSPERNAWLAERREMIARARTISDEQAILDLSRIVRGIGSDLPNASEEAKQLHAEALNLLLSIPGHAEYYRDKILQALERFRNPGGGTTWSEYREAIGNGFQVFPHLHSPEGVRVLGELLSNDWVPPGNETAIASEKFAPLSVSATVAFPKFPLLDKPFKGPITQANVADAQAAWQHWYEQIKSGKRTFRFEGDPTEYDLNGPAPGQKLAQISRDRKRDAEQQADRERTSGSSVVAESATASKPSKSMPVALLTAAMVLLVSMGWYFLQSRKTP